MADRYSAKDIQGLWDETRQSYSRSRRNIQLVRRWLAQEVPPEVPADFQDQVDLRLQLPIAITTSAHTIQLLGRKRPKIKRIPLGKGIAPQRRSSKIEQWANAFPKQLEDQGGPLWRPWVEGLFSHGEAAMLCYPYTAHFERYPSMYERDSEGKEQVRPGFQRDSKGRDPEDDYFIEPGRKRSFSLDYKQSKSAYDSFQVDWRARNLSIVARVAPADQALPLMGPNWKPKGIIECSEYSEYDLKQKGYEWIGGDRMIGPGQSENSASSLSRTRSLITLHLPGKICYWVGSRPESIGGESGGFSGLAEKIGLKSRRPEQAMFVREVYETTKDGKPAEINLEEQYGYEGPHFYYGYGAHWAIESDPDRRALPFLFAFTSALHFLNSVINAKGVQMWNRAFGQDYIEVDPNVLEQAPNLIADESGHPRKLPRQPNIATYVGGRVVRGYDTTASQEVDEMVGLLLGTVKDEAPNPAVFGGEGAASGHDRTLIRAFLEMAYHDVLDGGLGGWRWLASSGLQWATCIARTTGKSVPLYVQPDEE